MEHGGHALDPQFAVMERTTVHIQLQSNRRHFSRLRVVTPDRILLPEARVHLQSSDSSHEYQVKLKYYSIKMHTHTRVRVFFFRKAAVFRVGQLSQYSD